MNRTKKSLTPKKNTKRSSRKNSNSTANKSPKTTPIRTRSRGLPKSPISESMKQSKIRDFFKPISPSIGPFTQSTSQTEEPEVEIVAQKTTSVRKRAKKGPKVVEPVFGTKTRYSLRKSNESNSAKKLRFDTNEGQIESSECHQSCDQISDEVMDCSHVVNHNSGAKELQNVFKINKRPKNKGKDNSVCNQNLDQLMDELNITVKPKCSTNSTKTLSPTLESIYLDKRKTTSSDSVVNTLKAVNNLSEELDLMPVFKIPEVPKQRKGSKENSNKYVDKEKEKRMSYFLKNLSRIKKDKEMLCIQSFETMEIETTKEKSEELVIREEFRIKPFKGIDIFGDFIPKTIEKYLTEETVLISSENMINFNGLPLNRLLPLVSTQRLKESERHQIVSQMINFVSTEDNPIIYSEIQQKLMDLLLDNEFEIYLSHLLKDFYRILSKIGVNLKNPIDCDMKKELKFLSNLIEIISQILSQSSFKIEAMDSVEEFIKLLIVSFGLGADYRLIQNGEQIIEIKNFISVLLNNIFIDELKALSIVENLISFCASEEKRDVMIALHIASLFPLNIDFELKRKFCISVIQLFNLQISVEFELNLNELTNILKEIDWKSLLAEDIYVIIQMIGLSLDLPKDLIEHKQTISNILGIVDNKLNNCLSKASELEFSEIHKSLMLLRTKVNVSTKRF